jgi:hypothetical protein
VDSGYHLLMKDRDACHIRMGFVIAAKTDIVGGVLQRVKNILGFPRADIALYFRVPCVELTEDRGKIIALDRVDGADVNGSVQLAGMLICDSDSFIQNIQGLIYIIVKFFSVFCKVNVPALFFKKGDAKLLFERRDGTA